MPSPVTQAEFIKKSNEIHNNKYDYSEVKYSGMQNKITIKCPSHGNFEQKPYLHINAKNGCPQCGLKKRTVSKVKPLDDYISTARNVHNNKYDYTETIYATLHDKIKIKCPSHGMFEQKAYSHIQGHGCPKCPGSRGKLDTCEFVKRARATHGDKYDYEHAVYFTCEVKVIIVCREHGPFLQRPISHIRGDGCPGCKADNVRKRCADTINGFILKAMKVHGDYYDYSHIKKYVNRFTKIPIRCRVHDWIFYQSPSDHLEGCGCRKCAYAGYSKSSIEWLDSIMRAEGIHIRHAENEGEHRIRYKSKRCNRIKILNVDGYCKETKTVYEYCGDYHHGHPPHLCKRTKKNKFNPNDINPSRKVTYAELYKATIKRKKILEALGYNVVMKWECEFLDI
jgi:hypothetical protein